MAGGTLVVRVIGDVREFNAQMRGLAAQLELTGRRLTQTGSMLTRTFTVPIALAAGAAVKLSMDFENSMAKIRGLVGLSADEVARMREEVLALAPAVGKSPQELADALYFITSAGLSGQRALDALEASARASAAGLGETKTVADAVTSAMNAYAQSGLTAEHATDILVAAVREGKAETEELATTIGGVLSPAAQVGVSFDQVAAAIAAVTREGVDAAQAATGLRFLLASFVKPSQEAKDALAGIGLGVADLQAMLSQRGLLATLQELASRFDLTTAAGREAFLTIIGGARGAKVALPLVGENAAEVEGIFQRLASTSGDTARAFAEMAKTSGFKWSQAVQEMKTTLISFGDAIAPVVAELAKKLAALVGVLADMPMPLKRIAVMAGLVLAALGPMLTLLGRLHSVLAVVVGVLPRVVDWIGRFIAGFRDARVAASAFSGTAGTLGGLMRAALVPAIGAVTAAVTVGVTAWMWWRRRQEEARRTTEELTEALKADAGAIGEQTRELIASKLAQEGLVEAARDAGVSLDRVVAAVIGERGALADLRGELARTVEEHARDAATGRILVYVQDEVSKGAERLLDKLPGLAESFAEARRQQKDYAAAAEAAARATDEARKSTDEARRAVVRFAGMAGSKLEEWRESTSKSFADALSSLSGYRRGWELTSREMARAVAGMAGKARTLAADMRTLDKAGVPERFRVWLLQQGPDAVHAFAGATERGKDQMVRSWRTLDQATRDVANHIQHLGDDLASPFNRARDAVGGVIGKLQQLSGMRVTAYVRVLQTGAAAVSPPPPRLASGGVVTRPTLALVGESGPEAVVPLRRAAGLAPQQVTVNVTVEGHVWRTEELAAELERALTRRLRRSGALFDGAVR